MTGGILGNVSVSGNVEATGALVSGGVIGDVTAGTLFSSGAIKGIVAAEGDINLGGTGNTSSALGLGGCTLPTKILAINW